MNRTGSKLSYFLWLCDLVQLKRHKEFRKLLRHLNSLSFYSIVNFDDNRALDGLGLRNLYNIQTKEEPPEGDCTVLEVLIALAERMAYILYDPDLPNEDQIYYWFWHFLENLKLKPYDTANNNLIKIQRWLDRKYEFDGHGGVFPLKHPNEDQTKVELWYQMQSYITEILY